MSPHRRRLTREHSPQNGRCLICRKTPWTAGVVGCVALDVRGLPRVPHSWPEGLLLDGEPLGDHDPCQCGTLPGLLHHWPCDIELCPHADEHPDDGEQLFCCGCIP